MTLLPRIVAAIAIGVSVASSVAFAQVADGNNPYKGLESTKPVWPVFYKPDPSDATYTKLMANGMCKPTGRRAQEYYKSKMVDVNKLPETSFEGKITALGNGVMTIVDSRTNESMTVFVHASPAISRVNVHGKGSTELLTMGSFIQFVGRVDPAGVAVEKIDHVELISGRTAPAVAVEANKLQTLTGKIVRHEGTHLVVLTSSVKLHRLTIDLSPAVEVSAHYSDYHLASVGDTAKFQGRILRSTVAGQTFCFADDLDVVANALVHPPKTDATATTASRRSN